MRLTIAFSVFLLVAMSFGAPARAQSCGPEATRALQVRLLQTEIMVAALHCDRPEAYNAFIARFGDALVDHGHVLRRHFRGLHGRQGEAMLGDFVTALANQAANGLSRQGRSACTHIAGLFSDLDRLPGDQLEHFAGSRARFDAHSPLPCTIASAAAD